VVLAWYWLLPARPAVDLAFLAIMAAPMVLDIFRRIYASPAEGFDLRFLGQLMWIRTGISAVLIIRSIEGVGFGFLPRRREWAIGLRHYVYFLPLGLVLALALDFARFTPARGWWWKLAPTFLGMLWVVALSEEFFFRGLLQRWAATWLESTAAGLVIAAVLFGAVHLGFRSFPNWRFAALSALAGLFYGRAFEKAGGIRAAMVTHALTATTWRLLFS
jgi:membrane protease YdiL (CAAX protease family)